jgi:hypothetical protein
MFNKLSKLILIALMLICMAPAFASDDEARGTFVAEKDTRLYLPTPTGKLKNGKYAYFSFIVPKGFSTDECPGIRKNSKGEVLCGESEGEFSLRNTEKSQAGEARVAEMYPMQGRMPKKPKDKDDFLKKHVRGYIVDAMKGKILAEGPFPPSMRAQGYYGVYISSGQRITRVMDHYSGGCDFVSVYFEHQPENTQPIKVEKWLHGDAQEKLQDSFRCDELSDKDLSKFKKAQDKK